MSNDKVIIHDGTTDTTVRLGVDGAGRVDVDHGGRDVQDAAKAVTGAVRHFLSAQDGPLLTLAPVKKDMLRVLGVQDGVSPPRRLLTLNVVDGRLVAEFDPDDLTDAAKQFVDSVMQRWIAEQDANRRFTADTLEVVLRAAAQQHGDGDTISVGDAARVIAELMWGHP